jgi:cyclopropane fatty-acyl-phospholipid synthase-like methyltransferase
MALLMANNGHWQKHWSARIGLFAETYLAFWNFFNLPGRARRNVVHHYNLKDSLFDHFLNPHRQYSCSYFHTAHDTLADAQITKLARLRAKLCLQPNQKVLDIGCGWEGLANAARHFDSYFASFARLLAPNGVALVHSIGVNHNTKRCNRWLNKYIFQGAIYPRLNKWRVWRGAKGW